MYPNAEFHADSDFAITHGLNPRFDWVMDSQSQRAYLKRTQEEKGQTYYVWF